MPDELGNCVNLKVLHLAANALTSLPDSLSGLKNRKKMELNMQDNKPPVNKAGLAKLLAKMSQNCLGGEPVPADLAIFWQGQLSNDSLIGETAYGEVELLSEYGPSFWEMFEGSEGEDIMNRPNRETPWRVSCRAERGEAFSRRARAGLRVRRGDFSVSARRSARLSEAVTRVAEFAA